MSPSLIIKKAAPLYTFILISLLWGCSAKFNTKSDYYYSQLQLNRGKIENAVRDLPLAERNSFITTMEKAYLKLLSGKPEIDELLAYAKKIEHRLRYSVSRELKTFFYMETPEGYYASEHEIVWMHLLLSWGFSMRGEFEKAYVEAKKSSVLLSTNWSQEGRFDDPFIRVVLAVMWTMCGHWDEAQVDFRVAADLKPELKWARKLGTLEKPPKNLFLVLGGVGPEPVWTPSLKANPFRGFRGITFRGRGIKSALAMKDGKGEDHLLDITPDSSKWYSRHFIRDNSIQELVKDSTYGRSLVVSSMKGAGRSAIGIAGGIIIAAAGIALGGGIIIAGLYIKSAEVAAAGIVPLIVGPAWGYDFAGDQVNKSYRDLKRTADVSNRYRFVRFLPEYGWLGWSRNSLIYPFTIFNKKDSVLTIDKNDKGLPGITDTRIRFYPDTGE